VNESLPIKERILRFLEANSDVSLEREANDDNQAKVVKTNDPIQNDSIKEINLNIDTKAQMFEANETSATVENHEELSRKRQRTQTSVMVILIGLPGSGKSTFTEVLKTSTAIGDRIERLCQDEIGKLACEENCHRLLSGRTGSIVVIDRTNMSEEQRSTWVKVANRYKARCIAVSFNVPDNVCIERAMQRIDHPTLPREKVPAVVKSLAKSYQPPKEGEGFDLIIVCNDDLQQAKNQIEDYIANV
jgi:predicted kinase